MKRVCPYCLKVVDVHHACDKKKRRSYKKTYQRKIRSSYRWTKLSLFIRERDYAVCQASINGLFGEPRIETRRLEVHHIVPIEEDASKAFDPLNLITLCHEAHEKAEAGEIDRNKLLEIAKRNQERYEREKI